MDVAAKTSSEMHSEEGKARVWNWIHETTNEICALRRDLVILPPEGNDLRVRSGTSQPSKKRRLETGAHDEIVKDPFVRIGGDVYRRGTHINRHDLVPQNHLASPQNDVGGQLFGNDAEVHDRRSRNQQRREPLNMWLALTKL